MFGMNGNNSSNGNNGNNNGMMFMPNQQQMMNSFNKGNNNGGMGNNGMMQQKMMNGGMMMNNGMNGYGFNNNNNGMMSAAEQKQQQNMMKKRRHMMLQQRIKQMQDPHPNWWVNFNPSAPPKVSPVPPQMVGGPKDVRAPPAAARSLTQVRDYFVGPQICEGSYGMVRQAVLQAAAGAARPTVYAMKILEKERFLETEVELQTSLSHSHVAMIHESFIEDGLVFIVMEFCRGGDLYEFVNIRGRLSEKLGRRLFQQMVVAVAVLHKNHICHHDVKLENFLITPDFKHVKLSDFGAAEVVGPEGSSIRYKGQVCAPEKNPDGISYDAYRADIYQLGKMLHELHCMLRPPTCNGEINLPDMFGYKLSPLLTDLIKSMLQTDPSKRPTLEEIMLHPWFHGSPFHHTEVDHPICTNLRRRRQASDASVKSSASNCISSVPDNDETRSESPAVSEERATPTLE
jgi:hypothetical protein